MTSRYQQYPPPDLPDLTHWFASERSPDVPEGAPFYAWRLRTKSTQEFDALSAREKLLYFAWFGSLAPTTHNTIPQRFLLRPDSKSIEIFVDRGTPESPTVLAASDAVGRQASISLGSVLQHMALASQSYAISYTLEIDAAAEQWIKPPQPNEERYIPVARMAFGLDEPVHLENGAWLQAMLTRKSERKPYSDSIPIAKDVLAYLQEIAQQHDVKLHILDNAPAKSQLGTFQSMADTYVLNDPKFARELGDWLLENDSDHFVGIRGIEFGFDDPTAVKYSRGLKGELPLKVQDLAGFTLGGKSLMKDCSAVFVVTVPTDNLAYRIKAGQVFDIATLFLHRNGFSTSMHAGITEVDMANKAFAASLGNVHERPVVVFRAGKPLPEANQIRPHSSRPPLAEMLLRENE